MICEKNSWSFYGYVTPPPAGRQDVQDWLNQLHEDIKDEAIDKLSYLQVLPFHLWGRPKFAPLGEGLSEIRFDVNSLKKTFRIYGCCWPASKRNSYTLLLGTEKKVNNPKGDVSEAKKRKRNLECGKASVHEFKF